jgi:hypothetical protein
MFSGSWPGTHPPQRARAAAATHLYAGRAPTRHQMAAAPEAAALAADCGCFGGSGKVSAALVVRNVGLAMLALASAAVPLVWLAVTAFAILLLGTIPPTKRVLDRLAQAKASPWHAPNAAVVRE